MQTFILTKTKTLKICPVKKLYCELNENISTKKTAVILLSTEETVHPALSQLNFLHKINVMDTELEEHILSFSYEDGLKVKAFLKNDFTELYVCCDSGESRSAAMAAAIMTYYGNSDKEIWNNPYYHPNLLVYKKQLYAFGRRISKLKLKYLKYLSNRAFKKTIKKCR